MNWRATAARCASSACVELRRILEPHHCCEAGALGRVRRDDLRLAIVAVLQAMFKSAQEQVAVFEDARRGRGYQPARGERCKRGQRAAQPQCRFASGTDDLQCLHGELDLADAARAQLDVARDVLAPLLLADLTVDAAQALVGVVVEIFPIDERRHQLVELVVALAGERSGLEPGVALPSAPLRHQILLQCGERAGERSARPIGTQPHVDPEHIASAVDIGERSDHAATEAIEELTIRDRCRSRGLAFLGIDEDEVDIG